MRSEIAIASLLLDYINETSQTNHPGPSHKGHHIYGQHLNKISLSPFDSKRWIAEDGVNTLACGHEELVARDAAAMNAYIDELV